MFTFSGLTADGLTLKVPQNKTTAYEDFWNKTKRPNWAQPSTIIEGYASQSPYIRTKKYNSLVYLSELRAAYIADILSAAGISLDRLVKVGHGAKNPIVTVNDIKNKNQRAELRVLWPVDSQQDYEHLNRWW
jgi:outer membrane protein OmpA-like peptidoglycan-associated protein